MAQEPNTPRRPQRLKSPPPTDPYCLFENDEQRRLAPRFREGCRACCILVFAVLVMYLHPDAHVLFGGVVGVMYKLIWRQ